MGLLDPVDALVRLGTVTDGTTLRAACDPWQIRRAVAEGRIVRLARNRYVLPGAREAHLAAGRVHGVVSHRSAAQFWGWKVRDAPPLPEVIVPRGRNVDAGRREGMALRWRTLPDEHVHRGLVTTRGRTVLDCARDLPMAEALAVADSALREGALGRAELEDIVGSSSRRGRSRALRVLHLADRRAANPFESCLRAIAVTVPGLAVTPQLLVPGVGHADLGDPVLRLAIEADSHEFHSEKAAFRYDIRRYTAMVRGGWTVVRFCWEDVMHRPERVHDDLTAVVARLAPSGRSLRCQPGCPAA